MHRAQKFFADRSLGERKQQRFIHGIRRALGGGIKLPDGLDLVPEELDAHRALIFRRIHIENAAAQGIFSGHFDDVGGVVADRVEVGEQRVDVEHFAAANGPRQIGVILGRTQAKGGGGNRRNHETMPRRWQSSTARRPALPGFPGAATDSGRAARRGWEGRPRSPDRRPRSTHKKPAAPEPGLRPRDYPATTTISGRPAAFCSKTKSKAFAVGTSPETRIRPVPSFRWEATREKAGNFSTSVKRSRTKGRTMQIDFNRVGRKVLRDRHRTRRPRRPHPGGERSSRVLRFG